jgi:uncharacterized protein
MPMRRLLAASAAIAVVLFVSPAGAASLFDCGSSSTVYRTVCNDAELRSLGAEIDTEMARLTRGADPLTVLLLKRDQVWFTDILGAVNLSEFQGQDDAAYARLLASLKARRRALAHQRTGNVTTPEGSWSNAFASATVAKAAGEAFMLTLEARLSYPEANRGEIDCAAKVTGTLGKDGWYAANVSDKEDSDGRLDTIRFRLQGNTLRLVHEPNMEAGVCDGKPHESEGDRRGSADVLTGSFFATGPAVAGGSPARAVAPSFDCGKAENADEEEICADPDLAQADRGIARLYVDKIKTLEHKLAGFLRTDQRGWASDNSLGYLANLQPGQDKAQAMVHHTSDARRQLYLRQRLRLLLLANLDDQRKGLDGLWLGYNASLAFAPAKGKSDGTISAQGGKSDVEDYKAHCDFAGDGRIENGGFKTKDEFPKLTREAGTLLIEGNDEDQPGYCSRMRSPKARLFPVKAGVGIEAIMNELQ